MKRQQTTSWAMPVVTVIAVAASIVAAFFGSGALGGTAVSEAAGGWLSTSATPLAPGGGAFRIWSVIYLGLAGYAIWQLSAGARASSRQRALRPWAMLSAALNAAWIWMVQLDLLAGSVVVILALLAVLIRMLLLLRDSQPRSWAELILSDGTFGLYLGWVCVATVANIAGWLGSLGATTFTGWILAVYGVLAVAAAVGIATARYTQGRLAVGLALSWGLLWIAAGRFSGEFESAATAWGAVAAGIAVLVATVLIRIRSRRPLGPA
ncbi:tryptophan-rich sensory protein [Garicola koreensis]|uniref:Tryptophan-rich sensory protein n=1 Tax=Garicola koreensis TaxID=1262554 RepID=A0A7W5XKP4_9MICC|nr:tryptophan-rich sensory protein [Garicola koreensis]MBB3667802.1 hypothetical protein [Garicola koreensis]